MDELPLEETPEMMKAFKEIVAVVPKEQKIRYTITPIGCGLMNAKLIGEQMMLLAQLIEKSAREDGPRMAAALTGLSMTEEGDIIFDIAILPYKDKSLSQNRKDKAK